MSNRLEDYKKELDRLRNEINRLEKLIKARGTNPNSEAILSTLYDDIVKLERLIDNEKSKDTKEDNKWPYDTFLLLDPSSYSISEDMNIGDIAMHMCEGNPGAMSVIFNLFDRANGGYDELCICDALDIRGSKLYMLNNDCCGRNMDKMERTITMFKRGIYSKEEIQKNLGLSYAIPFIDDSIVIDGVPPYGEPFDETDDKWMEYCKKNRDTFMKKLESAMEPSGFGGK